MSKSISTRRKFLKGAGIAGGAAVAGTLATPHIAQAKTKVLKVQAAWGGGIFLENAKSYVDRVHAMAGKDLRIDLLSVNSVVKTSQMQDAVHRGVLDGAHYVPAYWYSKSKAASLFGTGPCFGWSAQELLGWIHYGGGQQLWDKLHGEFGMKPFIGPSTGTQMGGWLNKQITKLDDFKGVKFRMPGLGGEVLRALGALGALVLLGDLRELAVDPLGLEALVEERRLGGTAGSARCALVRPRFLPSAVGIRRLQ